MALWEYYHRLAQAAGTKDGKVQNFSVAWFYEENRPEDLNALTRAFLGDEDALAGIGCLSDEAAEAEGAHLRRFCTEKVNNSQLKAIAHALRDDISIIQGPPGTGKTETIGNLLRCLMHLPETPSVAVVSSNGEAIDNIITVVKKDPLLKVKDRYAQLGRQKLRQEFHAGHRNAPWSADFSKENGYRFSAGLLEDYPIIFSTIHSLRKCFVEDELFTGEFDYVIVDECSQVGNMLGLLAMASAKQLVLLGDDEQLAPVFTEEIQQIAPKEETQPFYLDRENNSFMKAVVARFGAHAGRSFLDQHYRCHPAIIGFCNQYIYENRLRICTEEDGKLPIRIRWYEGDYWETHKEEKKNIHQNLRQIKIFMEEEYPGILAKLRNDKKYSVCVLSPYRKPLEQLRKEIIECNRENGEDIEEPEIRTETQTEGEGDFNPAEKIPQLTIHKAQGRGYDLVVLLTITDCGRDGVWPQRKSMINVAVSRAKKELVILSSSTWMPRRMQKELLGYSVKSGVDGKESKLYLRRMMEYVREQSAQRETGDYGLQQSSLHSVFDRTMYYRERGYRDEITENARNVTPSAPELCMLHALCENAFIREQYEIYREVPLADVSAIEAPDDDCRAYMEKRARFDIVLVRNNKLCEIIEVDGAYHRTDPAQKTMDDMKDAAVASLGEAFQKRYFRFPTDGTSENEVAQVVEALQADAENLPEVETEGLNRFCLRETRMKEELVTMLNNVIRDAIQQIIDELESEDAERIKHVIKMHQRLNFQAGQKPDAEDYADPVFCALYLSRFGYAYAFEYSVIYDAVIRRYMGMEQGSRGNPVLGVCSLACGSMIDAWSLVYALARIREAGTDALPENLELSYHGVDRTRWDILFAGTGDELYDGTVNSGLSKRPNTNDPDCDIDVVDFLRRRGYRGRYKNYHWLNTICFAKFLNELEEEDIVRIENAIREVVEYGCYVEDNGENRKEYYICISHSAKTVDNTDDDQRLSDLASRIIQALNTNNSFDVDPRIMDSSHFCNLQDNQGNNIGLVSGEEEIPIYRFNCPFVIGNNRPYAAGINDLNSDFWGDEEVRLLARRMEELFNDKCETNLRKPMTYASYFRFQVIKLTRREG